MNTNAAFKIALLIMLLFYVLCTVKIWCLGSSIIKHAFAVARHRPGGINLGIEGVDIWWQGYGGLSLNDVIRKLGTLKAIGEEPDFILLHCGGNDLGRTPIKKLRLCVNEILTHIDSNFHAKVIWSEMLPRRAWRYSDNALAMESSRTRLNNYISNRVVKGKGFCIKHPDMQETTPAYYANDGVHPTFLGNCIFLNQLSSAIQAFLASGVTYFK